MKSFYGIFVFVLLNNPVLTTAQTDNPKFDQAFSKIATKEGTRDATLINDYGKRWKMRVTFPKTSLKKKPLIIALHWAGGGTTYKEFNDCLVVPALKDLNSIIVVPEGENQLWATENNVEKVLSAISGAKKYWNIDPDKIIVIGYSNGGNGSWYFAEKHPDLFTAAIPMASAYPIKKKISIPLYVIHGAKDELFKVDDTRKWVNTSKEAGSNIILSINENLSHFEACAYVEELRKGGEWLQELWNDK